MFLNNQQHYRYTANKLFQPGILGLEKRFLRKVWIKELDVPCSIARNSDNDDDDDDDPYGGPLVNCDIMGVDTSLNSLWSGSYETMNIAVGQLSINFIENPKKTQLIFITLDSNVKPKKHSLSALSYPIPQNGTDSLLIFDKILTPAHMLDDATMMQLSDTLFTVTNKRLQFVSIDINANNPFDCETLQLGCWTYDPKLEKVVNLKPTISSFAAEIIICNETMKMEYEALKNFNLSVPFGHALST